MPDPSIDDAITKSEAATLYRRSERSLSRDITNAIKVQDATVLDNISLRLEDGTRRPGRELTIKEIVELRDRGFTPTWLLRQGWLHQTYGRRNEPNADGGIARDIDEIVKLDPPSMGEVATTPVPANSPENVAVLAAKNDALERMNADLKSQTSRLEKELDRRAEERREENELQKQNNVLMQQVYDLLSKMQQTPGQINILNQGRDTPPAISDSPAREERSTVVVAGRPTGQRKGTGPQAAETRVKTTATPKKHSPAKRSTKRPRQVKKSREPRGQQTGTTAAKPRPSFSRAVRSFFRR